MRTKLDLIVGYLADRGDASAEPIRRELGEPSSETSLFLESLRERSRGMFPARPAGRHETPVGKTANIRPNSRRWAPLAAVAAAVVLLVAGVAWWDQNARLRRFEAALVHRDAEWKEQIRKLESAQNKAPASVVRTPSSTPPRIARNPNERASEILLARLETGLARLDERLNAPEGPMQPPVEPESVAQLRRELDGLQRESGSKDKALRKDLEELRTNLREVVRWVQQLAAQPPVQVPMQVPFLVPMPMLQGGAGNGGNFGGIPGQGLPSGLDHLIPHHNQPAQHGGNSGAHAPHHGNHESNNPR